MPTDFVYNFIIFSLFYSIFQLFIGIINKFYVPQNKPYEELTNTQKILTTMRFYDNIFGIIIVVYILINYRKYVNGLTILFFVSLLISNIRYFLLVKEYIYIFIDKSQRNKEIVDFIESPIGTVQNVCNLFLVIYIVFKLYFTKV
jgi:hypothetical protein